MLPDYRFLGSYLILLVFFLAIDIKAQENTKFPIGAFLNGSPVESVLASFDSSGLNLAAWHADNDTREFLENYTVIANNGNAADWIQYYATSYYSRWEAEGNYSIEHIGPKHKYGSDTVWKDIQCWSSKGLSAPACSLLYGPHYRQDQRHKNWYHTGNTWGVNYIPRYNLALYNPYSLDTDRNICVLKIVYRYGEVDSGQSWSVHDTTFLQDTLKISDFPQNGSFRIFNVVQNDTNYYTYPEKFQSAITSDKFAMSSTFPDIIEPGDTLVKYEDRNSDNGIQFCVDYLGNDSTILFIDYAEVYDENGWDEYIDNPQRVKDSLLYYVQKYSSWDNIKYWYGQDEPYSQDSFMPIHIVDSLVQHFGGAPVTQYFQPGWRIEVNGDSFMVDYYRKAQPPELIIDPYPFHAAWDPVRWEDLESLRQNFQIASSLKPGFWFVGQGFGEKIDSTWYIWRFPDPSELKASVMLSLAHGLKGLLFWNYNSYVSAKGVHVKGIVDSNGNPSQLWYLIHDNFVPRLEGKLGDRLLGLTYTGDFISARYFINADNASNQTIDYLTLPYNSLASTMNWHAGFFNREGYIDDKYFFVVNLLTNTAKSVPIKLTPPVSGYYNYRFRNIEGYFDTTFTVPHFSFTISHPPGEGYLYQVSPVVKYGGKLIYNDSVKTVIDLRDNLIIYPNAALTVTGTYNLYDTLIINQGGSLVVNGGKINVYEGGAIINNGTMTTSNNSELKFSEGICLRNNGYLNASGTLFSASSDSWGGIYFAANSSGMINSSTVEKVTAPGGAAITINDASPTVRYTTIQNCYNGINIYEESEPVILGNIILNTAENGIYIENSQPYIGGNTIEGGDSSAAVRCYNASPWFIDLETLEGRNTLRNGYYGVYADNYSTVYMGDEWEFYHLNRIIDNTYYAYAGNSSVIYAQLDWWGTDKPEESRFITGGESFIYNEPYLTEDPQEGFLQEGEGKYSLLSRQLITAKKLVSDSIYNQAAEIYKAIVTNYPDSAQAVIALTELKEVYGRTNDNTQLGFIAQLSDSSSNHPLKKHALETLSGIYIRKKNYPSAQAINNYLIHNYPDTKFERTGRRNKFYTHFAKKEFQDAREELETIKSKYEQDDQILAMDWLLYLEGYNPLLTNKTVATKSSVSPEKKLSLQNYPNPFNPSTTIRFYIEQRGKVNLTIYDILGRTVKTLINEIKEPGEYEVKFNGSYLASGVYIYRLQSNEQVLTRKFILIK